MAQLGSEHEGSEASPLFMELVRGKTALLRFQDLHTLRVIVEDCRHQCRPSVLEGHAGLAVEKEPDTFRVAILGRVHKGRLPVVVLLSGLVGTIEPNLKELTVLGCAHQIRLRACFVTEVCEVQRYFVCQLTGGVVISLENRLLNLLHHGLRQPLQFALGDILTRLSDRFLVRLPISGYLVLGNVAEHGPLVTRKDLPRNTRIVVICIVNEVPGGSDGKWILQVGNAILKRLERNRRLGKLVCESYDLVFKLLLLAFKGIIGSLAPCNLIKNLVLLVFNGESTLSVCAYNFINLLNLRLHILDLLILELDDGTEAYSFVLVPSDVV
eukprot:XP_001709482.1 Hypothetical protein GL50803_14262 [Giardia lamblia ATCC 50803]